MIWYQPTFSTSSFTTSCKSTPQTYQAISCPKTFALISPCVWSAHPLPLILALSHFPSHHLNITSSQGPFLILCILSRLLPDTFTCYYLIYHFYRAYHTNFLGYLFNGILSIFPQECNSSRARICSVLLLLLDPAQCLA